MKIHILGIAGTFMGSLAILAKQAGMDVTGQDNNVYPPMSTSLEKNNVIVTEGFEIAEMPEDVDCVVVGNIMRRGLPIIEHIMNNDIDFYSGPEFLSKFIIKDKKVISVSGTHGKTTTSTIVTHILKSAGLNPSYLIGGVANDFAESALLTDSDLFVIEADEYDCAFFDKRSKFVHYKADTLIINNIEFDHADIFENIDVILKRFHFLIRTIPGKNHIVHNLDCKYSNKVIEMGCWSNQYSFSKDSNDSTINISIFPHEDLSMSLLGEHNKYNMMAAILACQRYGVSQEDSIQYLKNFKGVKRRLELVIDKEIKVYSDFAHHPTAIETTINGLKTIIPKNSNLFLIIELGSNTMKNGTHKDRLQEIYNKYDNVYFYADKNNIKFNMDHLYLDEDIILNDLKSKIKSGDVLLIMSNTGFIKVIDKISTWIVEPTFV